jgi:hypothetical protein
MEIIDILFRSIFLGFIVWTVFWTLTKKHRFLGHEIKEIDNFVIYTVITAGIIHMILLTSNFIKIDNGVEVNTSLSERAFGAYCYGFWMYPVTYFGLTQLLLIQKIRTTKAIRIILAIWLFAVLHFEAFVIFVTSLYRDYAPEGSKEFPTYILKQVGVSWLISLSIFVIFIIAGLKIRKAVQHGLN